MNYTLSIPQSTITAETSATGMQIVQVRLVPDYENLLHIVNAESAIPIDTEAVINFTEVFLRIAHDAGYDIDRTFTTLDPYVQDTPFLLSIGVQKVHQAFTLRERLINWMEAVCQFLETVQVEPSQSDTTV